jgi:hypothetical protein
MSVAFSPCADGADLTRPSRQVNGQRIPRPDDQESGSLFRPAELADLGQPISPTPTRLNREPTLATPTHNRQQYGRIYGIPAMRAEHQFSAHLCFMVLLRNPSKRDPIVHNALPLYSNINKQKDETNETAHKLR